MFGSNRFDECEICGMNKLETIIYGMVYIHSLYALNNH